MSVITTQITTNTGFIDITPSIVAPNGNIYFSKGSYNVYVYSLTGTYIATINVSDYITQFTIDYTNNIIYCAGPTSFFSINPTTNTVGTSYPNGIIGCAFSTDGYVYCTSNVGYAINKITPSTGASTTIFTSSGGNIANTNGSTFQQCTFDSNQYLYCVTRGLGNIYKFDRNGTLLGLISTVGRVYGDVYGLTCDITTNILYASSIGGGSPGAVYKIKDGNSTVYTTLTSSAYGSSYSIFYDKITAKLYASNRPYYVVAINPILSDYYSINQSTLTYGSTSSFQLSYSSMDLSSNVTYVLKNGSTTLDTKLYIGYVKGGAGMLIYTSAVDQSGIVWVDSGAVKPLSSNLTSILKQSYSPFSNISVAYPTYAGPNIYSRLRYYNNRLYYVACGGWVGTQAGYFGIMDPTAQTFTSWFSDTNVTRYHNDIAISQEGVGYACSAVWNDSATKLTHQWKIDKIDLQTGAVTNLIDASYGAFETVTSGSQDGLSGITFDASDNFYALTYSGYISKWSKTGTRLMTPRQFNDPLGGIIPGSGRFDCDKSTNNLYIGGKNNNLCLINTNTLSVANVLTLTSKVFDPCIDNVRKHLYFSDSVNSFYRLDLNAVPTVTFNVTLANITENTLQMYDASGNPFGIPIIITGTYPCFREGSKILKLDPETDEECYVPVETLRQGDLIRTATCGYKAVAFIGRGTLPNPADDPDKKNRLYRFQDARKKHPPLYVTGEHCLLYKEKEITEKKRREVKEHMGDDYITETYHRVPACLDDRGTPYCGINDGKGPVTIWHFALEHNNLYNNYAVWANGILVETCSIDFLVKKSRLELV